MSRIAEFYSLDVAFVVFIVLFVIGRVVSRTALRLLDDDSKVKLVDAAARSNWWYLPFVVIIAMFFWHFAVAVVALIFYMVLAMGYNIQWHYRNRMPKQYVSRVLVANGIILLGFLMLALGYAAETI